MAELQHDTTAALDFLEHWSPGGPWVLTSIVPDGGKAITRTFQGKNRALDARKFVDDNQGKNNLYFMCNPARRPLDSKAAKEDVREFAWFHVDCDPRAREDFQSERRRILDTLNGFKPAPTVIIDSGGGYQAFWKLAQPQQVDGDAQKIETLEAYNRQLELLLGGDHCFNADRIMRLPGTINVPGVKKARKGRAAALASVVRADWGLVHLLTAFAAAPKLQNREERGIAGTPRMANISGNLKRLNSVEDLGSQVSDRTKMLIVQGSDPDDPTRWASRSEVLFHVCCELVRNDVDDDTIAAVILDPDFGVSSSVLDKKRPEEYAARQIAKAREHAVHPVLAEFNEKFAVIRSIGGKTRVVISCWNEVLKRDIVEFQSFDDFKNSWCNRFVDLGFVNNKGVMQKEAAGKWWLSHEKRRTYESLIFAPGREPRDAFNLWKGFNCEQRPGDCSLYLRHVEENICSGNKEYYEYLVNWMANAVQHPDRPGEVAIVLRGEMGTGKGMFARIFGSLWGRHFLQVTDPKHLVGSFNAHLRDCVLLFGDEAFYAGDKKHESILKGLVTEDTLAIEAKGVDVVASPNYIHLILASNSEWVVPAGVRERRFLVLDVSEKKMQDHEYFRRIRDQMDAGGREALLHYLMTLDLGQFEVRKAPATTALREQKQYNFSPEQLWWFERITTGTVLRRHSRFEPVVPREALQDDYLQFMQSHGFYVRRASGTMMEMLLHKMCPDGFPRRRQAFIEEDYADEHGQPRTRKRRQWVYEFPALASLRKFFDEKQGGPYDWPPDAPEQDDLPAVDKAPF